MERYDLKLAPTINTGVDDNKSIDVNIPDFVPRATQELPPLLLRKVISKSFSYARVYRRYSSPPGLPLTFSYSISMNVHGVTPLKATTFK